MPPKKAKVVDPEVLQRQWEDYQKTTESELWNDLYGLRGKFDGNTSETTQHLTGEWQGYHDLLFKLCTEVKVKAKKPFLHEFIRSAFYGQDQLKDQDQKIYFTVYGKKIIFSNQSANACRAVRKAFIEIWRLLETAIEINEQTFAKSRKDMTALLKKFNTAYNEHIKSSHEEVSAILEFEMAPLESILISNIKWKVFYEMCEYNEDKVYVSSFKEKALAEKFCQDFDNWLRHMYEYCALRPGFTVPEILAHRILIKLKYENWRKNTIECFYLKPLWEAFYKLSSNLGQLFSMGKDYWKLPMQANEGIRADLVEVIDMEIKAEVLLGTELKRDQMKFLYDVIAIIFKSPAVKLLFDKEKKPLHDTVIPRLTIYKTLQHMIRVEEKRLKEEGNKVKEEVKVDEAMAKTITDAKDVNVPMMATTRSSKLGATMNMKPMEEKTPDQLEDEDAKKYGRLYMWKDYMSPPCRELMLKLTKDVERINALVQFDMEDYIIAEGTKPQPTSTGPNKAVANMLLPKKPGQPVTQPDKDDKKANTIIVKVIDRRPPFLWNDPNTEEAEITEHKYRESAKPQDCYIDHRVEKLLQKINELADDLKRTTPERWEMIVNRTIDVFEEAEKEKTK